jgi:methyl-accepting chemotaxis protein
MRKSTGRPQKARSLVTILAIAIAAQAVGALLFSGAVQALANYLNRQTAISQEQQTIADQVSQKVVGFVDEKFSVLEAAVEFSDPLASTSEEQKILLDKLLGLQISFKQLALLNAGGRQLALASRRSLTQSDQFTAQLTEDLLERNRGGERAISPVYIDVESSEPLVVIALPILNVFDEYQGTLAAELNLKFLWELVDQLQVGETGYAYVVDETGTLIAFSDVSRVLRRENVGSIGALGEFLKNPTASQNITPQASPRRPSSERMCHWVPRPGRW